MSLRTKILLAVAAVNVAATVLLALFLFRDLERRELALKRREQEHYQESLAALERTFGGLLSSGALEIEASSGALQDTAEAAPILSSLLDHPVCNLIQDGIILNNPRGGPGEREIYLNLVGAKGRSPDFDAATARKKIEEAVRKGAVIAEKDWVAAPIHLRPRHGSPGRSKPWGGGFFVLPRLPELARWTPTFEPRTLVLGMLAGTALLVLITYLLLDRWILHPLGYLGKGAERVAQRRFDEPVPGAERSDEIGRLIATFNGMMAEVWDAQQSLTERVDEATRRAEESRRGLVIAQRLAATGTLASGIAHEINNPLGGMLNAALKVKRQAESLPPGSALRTDYIDLIIGGLQRIQEIVRRVLTFSPRRVEPARVSVRELVEKAVALAEHRARTSKVRFRVEGDDQLIIAEAGEIQQVLLNLLINACDALQASGGEVKVRLGHTEDWVEVEVADTGPGMTEEQKERAFDLFYSTKEVGQGTGLGLSVASHIITQHGGTLTLDTVLGGGTSFLIRLPRVRSSTSRVTSERS